MTQVFLMCKVAEGEFPGVPQTSALRTRIVLLLICNASLFNQ